jgi:putative SOS response-associated peptidase YedK
VIVTDASEVVEKMNDRMPVTIQAKDYDRRLTADPNRRPIDLLRPFDADKMTAWKVARAVGIVKNDSPELIAPVSLAPHNLEERLEDGPGSIFS